VFARNLCYYLAIKRRKARSGECREISVKKKKIWLKDLKFHQNHSNFLTLSSNGI